MLALIHTCQAIVQGIVQFCEENEIDSQTVGLVRGTKEFESQMIPIKVIFEPLMKISYPNLASTSTNQPPTVLPCCASVQCLALTAAPFWPSSLP